MRLMQKRMYVLSLRHNRITMSLRDGWRPMPTSGIAEFGLSLDGQSANWGQCEFESFKQLNTKFIRLFHRQVPQMKLMGPFYAVYQETHETIPQFIDRFQNLWRPLARQPPEDDVKETFLSELKGPLRTTLDVFDFKDQSLEQVSDKALLMDKTQTLNSMWWCHYRSPYQPQTNCASDRQFNALLLSIRGIPQWNAHFTHIALFAIQRHIQSTSVNIIC